MRNEVTGVAKLSAARESVLMQTADALLNARRTGQAITDLPLELQPANETEAFWVQDRMMQSFEPVGGWKIGARGPEATPFFAPMPRAWMGESGSIYRGGHRLFGVEAEIAFFIGSDLQPRSTPYTRDEVTRAIASCHPSIEILESAYVNPEAVPRENMMADLQMHGGFVAGPAFEEWHQVDWAEEAVTLIIDGSIRKQRQASNPGGTDLIRLLVYLANEGAVRTGGLKAGQWVTTGSWTGADWTHAGADIRVQFSQAGSASLVFA